MLKVGQQKHKFVNKYSKTCFGVGIQGHNSVGTLERTIIYNVAVGVWCELTDFEGGGFWSTSMYKF